MWDAGDLGEVPVKTIPLIAMVALTIASGKVVSAPQTGVCAKQIHDFVGNRFQQEVREIDFDYITDRGGREAKTTALALERYQHIERIPDAWEDWEVSPRGGRAIAASLAERRADAMLYKRLATLRVDVPLSEDLEELRWRGAFTDEYRAFCEELGLGGLADAPHRWR